MRTLVGYAALAVVGFGLVYLDSHLSENDKFAIGMIGFVVFMFALLAWLLIETFAPRDD